MSEYDFFQIDHTGVNEPDLTASGVARTNKAVPIRRAADEKVSYFRSGFVGSRMSSDYTRTGLDFESKDDLADQNVMTEDPGMGQNVAGRSTNVDHNPYVAGSTVKKVRDAQFHRMGMSGFTTVSGAAYSIDAPNFDVMDTNLVSKNMVAGKNWPSEGWRSFGGKYDFMPYQGGGIH